MEGEFSKSGRAPFSIQVYTTRFRQGSQGARVFGRPSLEGTKHEQVPAGEPCEASVRHAVVTGAEKYESKALVDRVEFRGSDVAASNVRDALRRFAVSTLAGNPLAIGLMRTNAVKTTIVDAKGNTATSMHATRSTSENRSC